MIGLAGSHRSGKSTLAREFAKKHGLLFVQTSASSVFEDFGIDPASMMDFDTRLMVQEEILRRFDAQYATAAGLEAITDRTPLDLLAYTMAEAIQNNVSDTGRFMKYAQACLDVTNKRFGVLLVVQPGIRLVAEKGKAALNEAYIEHLNSLILGLSVDERIRVPHFYVPRYMTDLKSRIRALEFAVARVKKRAEAECEDASIH